MVFLWGLIISSGAAASTLLYDNFSAGDGQWTEAGGTWSIVGGEYRGEDPTGDCAKSIAGNGSWTDYTYTGKFLVEQGAEATLLFRVQDASPGKNNGHFYQISNYPNSDVVWIQHISNGNSPKLSTTYVLDYNVWYDFRIVLQGNNVDYYINDDYALSYDGLIYLDGNIGVKTYKGSAATGVARFDDIQVFGYQSPIYYLVNQWGGFGTADGKFDSPWHIDKDSQGYVYICDILNSRIQKFTSDGIFVTKWSGLLRPRGIAVGPSGYIYVTDTSLHCVKKFTNNGQLVATWNTPGMNVPYGVDVDSLGNIYVAGDGLIRKLGSNGELITSWATADTPTDVAVDSSGHVYVSCYGANRIQKFTTSGNFVTEWGTAGTGDGQFNSPYGIDVDDFGYVYVCEEYNHRVQKFSSDGAFITKWGSYNSGNGPFNEPIGIVVDLSGSVYVTNRGNNYIHKFATGPEGSPPSEDYYNGYQGDKSGDSGDPVSTATGNFFHSETDISIDARSLPLTFSRHYNSKNTRTGPLGQAWSHLYYIYLDNDDPNLINVHWGDSRTDYWNQDSLGGYEPNTVGLYDSLSKDGSNWIVTRKNLNKYTFDSNGLLTTISDKNGNTITLSYTNPSYPNLVTAISDPVGRTVTLSYNGSGLLDNITDFASPARTVQYSYTNGRLTQVTDVLGNTIDYTYDANGYLSEINDQRDVNTVTNIYDASGRVIEQYDGNDNKTIFSYDTPSDNQTTIIDPNGNITIHTHITDYKLLYSIQNPLGNSIFYSYDESGNRTSVTDRNGNTTSFIYDIRGNVTQTTAADGGITMVEYSDINFPDLPTKKTDALGNETTWQYDDKGNVVLQADPNDFERSWSYNGYGQKINETDENSNTTTYIYDTSGILSEIIDANDNHSWYGYDDLWRLTHLTDGRGSSAGDSTHTLVTAYDKADRVTSVTGPITSQSYQYDEIGRRTHVTNGRGYTTIYQYDNNNNLTRIESPAPSGQTQVIQYSYDELNRKISITDPNGNVTHYEYDLAGRLIKEINPEGDETSYTYDAHGNVLSVTDGSGVTTSYGYDSMNRKNHQYDELGNHWYWQYNKLGNLVKHTDSTGTITQYEYDPLNRLVAVIDDANNRTEYEYDSVGNLMQIQDAAGKIIERRYYNSANRLIRKEDGLAHAYEYEYDGAGNVISETTPNGHTKTFVYDNENRLIEIHYPDSSQITYIYDDNGNLTTMIDSTGTTTYTYDELDRLTSSTDSFSKIVQYGYDIIGNRTSITYPADSTNPTRTVTYTYDSANRLNTITDWAGGAWDYTIDGAGRITDVNNPNGMKEARSYDKAGRLLGLLYKNSTDANLITYSYTRDAMGNPTEIQETGTLEPSPDLLLKEDYTYDNDNRLTSTTAPSTYGYDNNGNMTSRVTGGVTTTFIYDYFYDNRLVSQTKEASTVQHIYDGHGNRIARNDNGSEIRYILDRGRSMSHVLCETDDSGDITTYYIQGLKLLARIGSDGSKHYYHTDHIGSVVALTGDTETVTDRYAYTPFGVPAGSESTTSNPFTYVGGLGVMAEADGLYFMRARFYDPDAGRFLSKDPIVGSYMDPASLAPYTYVANNCMSFSDPFGLWDPAQAVGASLEVPGMLIYSVGLGIGSIAQGGIASVADFAGYDEIAEQYHEFSTLERAMARDKIFNWGEDILQTGQYTSRETQTYLQDHSGLRPLHQTLEQGAKGVQLGYSLLSFHSALGNFGGKLGGISQLSKMSARELITNSNMKYFWGFLESSLGLANAVDQFAPYDYSPLNEPYIKEKDVKTISSGVKGHLQF